MDAHRQRQSEVVALAFAALASLTACSPSRPASDPTKAATATATHDALPFIDDDYPRALAAARKLKKPIFVDSWAPWCHSCLSMRSYVFTDPLLAPLAKDYVWLAIDTERADNASFVAKFTHDALPTLWVIDPDTEQPTWRWSGTLTATELRDALTNDKDAPPRGAHERVFELAREDPGSCALFAIGLLRDLPRGTPRADVLAAGLGCAVAAKLEEETGMLTELALKDAREAGGALLADDRSALFEAVVDARTERGDAAGARAVASEWAAFLETEARKAKTPRDRAVFDAHRLEAHVVLGQPERAVPMLLESERDFPDDYNPPARLARAYLEMNKLDDAAAAVERARARVYGPRVMRVLALAADIAKARGDRAAERRAIEEALARTEKATLTAGQRKVREGLAKRLAALPR